MKNCENCKYWQQDTDNNYKNFGWCKCDKFIFLEDLEENNPNNYHIISNDYGGCMVSLRMHKDFGCIDYEER